VEWSLNGKIISHDISPRWQLEPGEHVLAFKAMIGGRERKHRVWFLVLI